MSKDQKTELSARQLFGIGVVCYLAISYGIYLWLQGEVLPPNAETAGVLIQATLAAAAIFGVSLALLRIAHNSDNTFRKQREVAQQQRRDDQIEFVEKHFNDAVRPLQEFATALSWLAFTCVGVGQSAKMRVDVTRSNNEGGQITRDDEDQIWSRFRDDFIKFVEPALDSMSTTANQVINYWPTRALWTEKSAYELFESFSEALAIMRSAYPKFLVALEGDDTSFEKKELLFDIMATAPHQVIQNMMLLARGKKYDLKDLEKAMPGISKLHKFLTVLINDEGAVGGLYRSLPSFSAALAKCGIAMPDSDSDQTKFRELLSAKDLESRKLLWFSPLLQNSI